MHIMKRTLTLCFGLMVFAAAAKAQPQKVVADKITAVVGDRIILYSDIQNSLVDIIRQGGTVPENGACLLMEQAVVSKILMLQAEKDSLPVTDDEVARMSVPGGASGYVGIAADLIEATFAEAPA